MYSLFEGMFDFLGLFRALIPVFETITLFLTGSYAMELSFISSTTTITESSGQPQISCSFNKLSNYLLDRTSPLIVTQITAQMSLKTNLPFLILLDI